MPRFVEGKTPTKSLTGSGKGWSLLRLETAYTEAGGLGGDQSSKKIPEDIEQRLPLSQHKERGKRYPKLTMRGTSATLLQPHATVFPVLLK